MIRDILHEMGGIGAFGIASMCFFFLVFVTAIAWSLKIRRSHVDKMSRLPLEEDDAAHGEPKHEP